MQEKPYGLPFLLYSGLIVGKPGFGYAVYNCIRGIRELAVFALGALPQK
jgi:hypothetical protein